MWPQKPRFQVSNLPNMIESTSWPGLLIEKLPLVNCKESIEIMTLNPKFKSDFKGFLKVFKKKLFSAAYVPLKSI